MKYKVGDRVLVECTSGLETGNENTVIEIKTKYTEDMGEPYPVIVLENNHEFDGDTLSALTPPYTYYIRHKIPS